MIVRFFVIDAPAAPREVRVRLRTWVTGHLAVEVRTRNDEWRAILTIDDTGYVDTDWPAVINEAGRLDPSIFPAFAGAPEPQDAAARPFRVGDRVRTDDGVAGVIVQLRKVLDGVEWAHVFRSGGNYADWRLVSSLTHADAAP